MGSSSSTQKSSAKSTRSAVTPRETSPPRPQIGSSTPPKGLPRKLANNRSSSDNAKATDNKSPSSGKASERQGSSATDKATEHQTQHSSKETKRQDGESGAKRINGQGSGSGLVIKGENGTEVNANGTDNNNHVKKTTSDDKTASQRRAMSAKRVQSARKGHVRKMEKGMEDEEDVDNVLGLKRMKTRTKLRMERSILRDEMGEVGRKKSLHTFRRATKQVRNLEKQTAGSHDDIYRGNVNIECPSRARIVRIFTSSTFTDTMHERNTLMRDGYPRVKAFCQGLGYDFQVVDMRWGIRDGATDDNMTTEMCLKELQMCQRLSTGPNFVTLMSHKYGYTDFPRCINAEEFETIVGQITEPELTGLFQKWYKKDLNALPPAYVVSPISANLPDFLSPDRDRKDAAKKQWWDESGRIQAALEDIAAKVFDAQTARKYIRSVSETEIQMGLLETTDPSKQCLWLKRTIKDLDDQAPSYILSRYTESTFNNPEEKVQKSQEMLRELKEKGIEKVLPPESIREFEVSWNADTGIDPDNVKAHADYLKRLSEDFVDVMCKMIKDAVDAKKETEDKLVDEISQHVQFCKDKCLTFHGRTDILKRAEKYLLGLNNEPLVLHADSGAGKTAIMAMVAREAWTWMGKKASIVTRFISTTPGSSNLHSLLSSITSQIRRSYGIASKVAEDLRTLMDEFESSLLFATSDHPLVLILDSLDMLDPAHNARQLQWLPTRLRSNIKIIVSTLPGAQYEAFPVLETTIHTKENFVEIPILPDNDVSAIVDARLALKNRTLTAQQKSVVMNAFKRCSLPLFLKLAVDKASAWASYTPKNLTVLGSTIRASIDNLFERLEKIHGNIFVSRALGYLSAARVGLTETELEDVLSCDDDVLNDVYMYWTPPLRRLPPLILVRLRTDLSQYLVDRGADNVRVMSWYHRQFLEAAQHRYCGNQQVCKQLHAALANFFAGVWANGTEKPFTSAKGDKGKADRHVSSQPNKYGTAYNLRKLNNLPYHRCHAHQQNKLKEECLANFEFLLDKLTATSLWQIMDDFAFAQTTFPNDELLRNIGDVLKLSQTGLLYEPNQLATQLIGRLTQSKVMEKFLQQCYAYPVPALLADKQILTQPGGQLLHSMAGHKGDILSLDLSADSKTALTCSDDCTIRIWDTKSGQQVRMLDGLGKVTRATFCNHDKYVYIVTNNKHSVRTVKSGEKLFDIPSVTDDSPSCVTGDGKSQLVVFKDLTATVYSAMDGSIKSSIECGGSFAFKYPAFAVGSKNYAAVTTEDQVYATVLDTKRNKFTAMFRGFDPFVDEDLDEIQYEIDEMTFTADEKYIVYSNVYTNDLVFLDFRTQQKTQVIKGNPYDYVHSLRCSPDNKSLYHVKAAFVNVLDMKTMKVSEELEHPVDLVSVCTHDMRTVVTTAEDSNVRVWDRTRKAQSISQNPGIAAFKIRMLTVHENPRYIVGFGFKTKDGDSQFLFVYDIINNCTVRERLLDSSILQFELLNASELLVLHDIVHSLCVIDIDTMKVTKVFQGYLPKKLLTFGVIHSRKEVACLSVSRKNVKLYDNSTGKCAAILPSGQTETLDGLKVNEDGTVLVTWCETSSGPVLLFDLATRKLLRKLEPAGLYITDGEIALSPDGRLLLFKVEGVPPGATKKNMDDAVYLEVWDVQKGGRISSLVDSEYYLRYHGTEEKSGLSSAVDVFSFLDNEKVLVAHDDYIMRVFDMRTGAILHRLEGHCTGIEIVNKRDSPFIITYGSWTEENSLRLWKRSDFTCVASYTLDKTITLLRWTSDGKCLLATTGKPAEIVTWKFNNFDPEITVNHDEYKVLFKGQDLQGYIDLVPEDESVKIDPDDPDKDAPSDDSDDDDECMPL